MAKPNTGDGRGSGNHFRFNLIGLIIFSLCLMGGTAFTIGKVFSERAKPHSFDDNLGVPDARDKTISTSDGPWGELLTQNIELERPAELITGEMIHPPPETWVFHGMSVAQVEALFAANGLTATEAEKALAPDRVSQQGNDTVFQPGEDFVVSLSPGQRQKLYGALYGMGVNPYLDYPHIFPAGSIESIYADPRLHPDDVALLQKLVYPNGGAMQMSDFEMLMSKIPTVQRRVTMSQALSRQPAVLATLCIRPDTDIDKLAGYWGHMDNVRFDDIRPLMQALKKLPDGGRISLMFLLPPFARARLYTYPVREEGDPPVMDCHWTTFNFSNEKPDNRFADPNYIFQDLKDNYYQINAPGIYGDIILLMDDQQNFKHSAVYLAGDLVFTKYGNNYTQPWMLVRMADMLAEYPTLKPVYFRKKTE
jgi:hypothetical protein